MIPKNAVCLAKAELCSGCFKGWWLDGFAVSNIYACTQFLRISNGTG